MQVKGRSQLSEQYNRQRSRHAGREMTFSVCQKNFTQLWSFSKLFQQRPRISTPNFTHRFRVHMYTIRWNFTQLYWNWTQ